MSTPLEVLGRFLGLFYCRQFLALMKIFEARVGLDKGRNTLSG